MVFWQFVEAFVSPLKQLRRKPRMVRVRGAFDRQLYSSRIGRVLRLRGREAPVGGAAAAGFLRDGQRDAFIERAGKQRQLTRAGAARDGDVTQVDRELVFDEFESVNHPA